MFKIRQSHSRGANIRTEGFVCERGGKVFETADRSVAEARLEQEKKTCRTKKTSSFWIVEA